MAALNWDFKRIIQRLCPAHLGASVLVFFVGFSGCSSKTAREEFEEKRTAPSKKSKGPILDHFYFESSFQPSRDVQKDSEFFYKRCEFVRRTRYPSPRSEFDCGIAPE